MVVTLGIALCGKATKNHPEALRCGTESAIYRPRSTDIVLQKPIVHRADCSWIFSAPPRCFLFFYRIHRHSPIKPGPAPLALDLNLAHLPQRVDHLPGQAAG